MYDAGFITKEQRDAALVDTVYIMEESPRSTADDMLYFVEYAMQDVVTHLLASRELLDTKTNRAAIENELQKWWLQYLPYRGYGNAANCSRHALELG